MNFILERNVPFNLLLETLSNDQKYIYYAHSMKIYNLNQEIKEIKLINQKFPKYKVINPSRIDFLDLKEVYRMNFCLKLVDLSDIIIFSEFNWAIGKGVYMEIFRGIRKEKKVYLLRNNNLTIFQPNKVSFKNIKDWKVNYAQINI